MTYDGQEGSGGGVPTDTVTLGGKFLEEVADRHRPPPAVPP